MEIKIQISDAVYAKLLNGYGRVKGSIGLVSPKRGNFNAYGNKAVTAPLRKYMKLPHGRVSMGEKDVRMCLKIDYTEQVIPARAIDAESRMASSFIDLMEELS